MIVGWCPAVTSESSGSAGGILRRFGKFCEDGYTGCIGNVEDDSGLVVIDVAGDLCHAGKDHAGLVSDIERVHGGERRGKIGDCRNGISSESSHKVSV